MQRDIGTLHAYLQKGVDDLPANIVLVCVKESRSQELVGAASDIIFAVQVLSWYRIVNTGGEVVLGLSNLCTGS